MSAKPIVEAPPPGQLFIDNGYKVTIVASVLSALCIAAVTARFLAARKKKADLWWDDWLCIPSLFFALVLNALDISLVKVGGVGRHTISYGGEVSEVLIKWGKLIYVETVIYSIAMPLPKLVLLLFYIRIFRSKNFKIAVYAVAFFTISWSPAVLFATIFQCNPVSYAWDKSVKGGSCFNVLAFFRYIAVPVVISDVAVLVLPLPMIWRLHTTTKQKLALSGVFTMGSMGIVASIARMVIFFQKNAFADPTWTSVALLSWAMVEVEVVLIAACLPSLKPLIASFWHSTAKLRSKRSSSSKTRESLSSSNGGGQKRGFTRIEDIANIHSTWDGRLVPMEPMPPPKAVDAGIAV